MRLGVDNWHSRVNGEVAETVVDFEHYTIECHSCDNLNHLLDDCHSFLA
jgi:hypothetical protein